MFDQFAVVSLEKSKQKNIYFAVSCLCAASGLQEPAPVAWSVNVKCIFE